MQKDSQAKSHVILLQIRSEVVWGASQSVGKSVCDAARRRVRRCRRISLRGLERTPLAGSPTKNKVPCGAWWDWGQGEDPPHPPVCVVFNRLSEEIKGPAGGLVGLQAGGRPPCIPP